MPVFTRTFTLSTREHNATVDITEQVRSIVAESGVRDGVCTVFTRHATAANTCRGEILVSREFSGRSGETGVDSLSKP